MTRKNEEIQFKVGETLYETLVNHGKNPKEYKFTVNGRPVSINYRLKDGDEDINGERIEDDNKIVVKVNKIPGKGQYYDLDPGSTVRDAIEVAGFSHLINSCEIRHNDDQASLNAEVRHDDTILLTTPIEGN